MKLATGAIAPRRLERNGWAARCAHAAACKTTPAAAAACLNRGDYARNA
jgi:hypothetical protein